mgnify:CR=1 FL=1
MGFEFKSDYKKGDLIRSKSGVMTTGYSPDSVGVVLEFVPRNVYDAPYVTALFEGREIHIECKYIERV